MNDSTPSKACRFCKRDLPATLEFFGASKDVARQGPLKATCRTCDNARKTPPEGMRWCVGCHGFLPADAEHFVPRADGKGGLKSECRTCNRQRLEKWITEHPEEMGKRRQKAHQKHKEARNAYTKEWAAANPDKRKQANRKDRLKNVERIHAQTKRYRENNLERIRERERVYRKLNRPIILAIRHRRRARAKASPSHFTKADVQAKYIQQAGKCYWCSKPLNGHYQVDHVIPLAKDGTNAASNIALTHAACNRQKHAKMPWEFVGRLM